MNSSTGFRVQPKLQLHDVSLKFRLFHRPNTAKERFAEFFSRKRRTDATTDFWALRDISLSITSGERLGIIGHNGAGKSTLLKTICRIYKPTTGRVTVSGRIAPLLELGAGFNPEMTGRENILLNGTILGYDRRTVRRIEPEVIQFTGLAEFIDTPVKYYSTGMYMRLAFAIATAVPPDILILDEVFAGGDAAFVARAEARMQQFMSSANVIIFVSHSLDLMRRLCTRLILLDHGRLVCDGEPDAVISHYLESVKGSGQ